MDAAQLRKNFGTDGDGDKKKDVNLVLQNIPMISKAQPFDDDDMDGEIAAMTLSDSFSQGHFSRVSSLLGHKQLAGGIL